MPCLEGSVSLGGAGGRTEGRTNLLEDGCWGVNYLPSCSSIIITPGETPVNYLKWSGCYAPNILRDKIFKKSKVNHRIY